MNYTVRTGAHRVLEPAERTPYDAWKLDAACALGPHELLLEVDWLNLDATSFRDLLAAAEGDMARVEAEIASIVAERGKMHNPRTGSGGVMAGRVAAVGSAREGEIALGTPVVTLVSNTLVPLSLERVLGVDSATHQVAVRGRAVLSPSARYAVVPDDLPLAAAVTVFDVCGVVPQTARLARAGGHVVVIGGAGRAGMLAVYAAMEQVGPSGRVVAVVPEASQLSAFTGLPAHVTPLVADATRPERLSAALETLWGERLADAVVDCANVRGTEVAAAALARDGGEVYFFNMATSFQAAALGAELLGRDLKLVIGFGLLPEAPAMALSLVRRHPALRAHFVRHCP